MVKKGLLRKCSVPVALALSVIMCTSTTLAVTRQNSAFADTSSYTYTSDYDSREEVYQATLDLNDQIAAEGMVMVKNKDNALPITNNSPRVSVFGYASTNVAVGASNASGDTSAGEVTADADLYSSLKNAGFVVNPVTQTFYEDATGSSDYAILNPSSDTSISSNSWNEKLKGLEYSYHSYSDAAIVMLGETGNTELSRHSRDYDTAQKTLVQYLGEKFSKVILLINTSYPFELGWAEEADYVDSIIIVGQPGNNGFNAVGKILNGEINPSGHLADTYATDFTVTPSYNNFNVSGATTGMTQYQNASGEQLGQTYIYQYEEGIYVGYRYYETMATLDGITVDVTASSTNAVSDNNGGYTQGGEDWYQDHVVYPFGYGLSYTEFEYDNFEITGEVSADGKITAKVTVTNVGEYAGKDVVQLYYSAPYDSESGVEKSAVVMGNYAKTDLLQPEESQTLTLTLSAADMASWNSELDKDGDSKAEGGYVLDKGDYVISLRSDSHTVLSNNNGDLEATLTLEDTINTGINVDTDGKDVVNQFDDLTETVNGTGSLAFNNALTRANMATTKTTASGAAIKLTSTEEEEWEHGMRIRRDSNDEYYDYWTESDGNGGYVMNGTYATSDRDAEASVVAADLVGKSYDDAKWDDLLNELNISELVKLFQEGGYGTSAISYIKLPGSHQMDGPYGWTSTRGDGSYDGLKTGNEQFPLFCSAVMVACTFNQELAEEEGKMIGEQGLWGNAENGGSSNTWTGWYSPDLNIHRSPFGSRDTEGYSEDPVLSGLTAANVAYGAQSKGTFVTLKHFAVYNDGNNAYRAVRNTADPSGFSVWLTEQTLREVYLKGFEIAVKQSGCTGVMSSFARIGYVYCGVNYSLCTQVLRNEWGFNGIVVTDIVFYGNQDGESMVLSGNNLSLQKGNAVSAKFNEDGSYNIASSSAGAIDVLYEYINAGKGADFDEAFEAYLKDSPKAATALYNALREGAHGIIYTIVNSNAMQVPYGATVNYTADTTVATSLTANESATIDLGTAALSTMDVTYGNMYGAEITYTVTSGALPTGMTLNSAGMLTGKPTTAGTYTFTVTASADGYEAASITYTIVVAAEAAETVTLPTDYATKDDVDGAVDEITEAISSSTTSETGSGCSNAVDVGSAMVMAVMGVSLICAITKIVRRKKENND